MRRMRWKTHFYVKKDTSNIAGFKTRNYPTQCKELQNFEKDLPDTIRLIEFWIIKDIIQRKQKGHFEYKIITRYLCLCRQDY